MGVLCRLVDFMSKNIILLDDLEVPVEVFPFMLWATSTDKKKL